RLVPGNRAIQQILVRIAVQAEAGYLTAAGLRLNPAVARIAEGESEKLLGQHGDLFAGTDRHHSGINDASGRCGLISAVAECGKQDICRSRSLVCQSKSI